MGDFELDKTNTFLHTCHAGNNGNGTVADTQCHMGSIEKWIIALEVYYSTVR